MDKPSQDSGEPTSTQIGIHSVRNLLGSHEQLSLFSEMKDTIREKGFNLDGIDRFGIELSETQFRMMEGILNAFTKTKYRGNIAPKRVEELEAEGHINETVYQNILEIPRIKATQKEILEWAGFKSPSPGEKERALQALHELATARFCFCYDRLSYDANGKPEKDSRGRWNKEEVVAVDTLFLVKQIKKPGAKRLSYYEISPSAIFLDQRENFYILIPQGWREEVQQLFQKKKLSVYVFRFLLFIRYQYELLRRSKNQTPPYTIRGSAEEIAYALKMPEVTIRRNRKRLNATLDEVYEVGKRVGYLVDYKRTDVLDTLILNEEKFTRALNAKGRPLEIKQPQDPQELKIQKERGVELFDFFYSELSKRVPGTTIPKAIVMNKQVLIFVQILSTHRFEDVKTLLSWGLDQKFWCTQLSTPLKLKENFSKAWMEMSVNLKHDPAIRSDANRNLAKQVFEALKAKGSPIKVEILNKYIEVGDGVHQPDVVEYNDKQFKSKVIEALRKRNVILDDDLISV